MAGRLNRCDWTTQTAMCMRSEYDFSLGWHMVPSEPTALGGKSGWRQGEPPLLVMTGPHSIDLCIYEKGVQGCTALISLS